MSTPPSDFASSAPARTVPPDSPAPSGPSRVLQVLLWIAAAAILAQAVLAGMFLSGQPGARHVHMIVGSVIPWLGLALIPVAVIQRRRRRCTGGLAVAAAVVPVMLWVQEVLGHMPFPVTTAIHVPFGVALLSYVVLLAVAAGRRWTDTA